MTFLNLPPILFGSGGGGGGGGFVMDENQLRSLVGLSALGPLDNAATLRPLTRLFYGYHLVMDEPQLRSLVGLSTLDPLSSAASLRALVRLFAYPYGSAVADPSLLPIANHQVSDWPAFNALNVPAMPAGSIYADPVFGTPVMKLTSAIFPAANTSMLHPYSSMGLQIAGPFGPNMDDYSVYLMNGISGAGFLIDVNRSTRAISNTRSTPWSSDTRFTFSMNPATPQIVYYMTNAGRFIRYDTSIMAEAPNAQFPSGGKDFTSLPGGAQQFIAVQSDVNDRVFAFMNVANTIIWAWDSVTNVVQTVDVARIRAIRPSPPAPVALTIDEPHLDHEGRYLYIKISQFTPVGGGYSFNTMVLDLQTTFMSDLVAGWTHHAPMRNMVTGLNVGNFSQETYTPSPVISEGYQPPGWPGAGGLFAFATDSQIGGGESHRAGQWVDQGAIADQQYVMLSQESPQNNRTKPGFSLVWTNAGGSIWTTDVTYQFQQVAMGGIGDVLELSADQASVVNRLTRKANLAAITGPGQWACVGTRLWVWRTDSLQPNSTDRVLSSQVVATAHECLAFMRLDGASTRCLGHPYSWNPDSADYYSQGHTTISRDGMLVISDSNMNNLNGRKDVLMWFTPTSSSAPTGPSPVAVFMYHHRRRVNAG